MSDFTENPSAALAAFVADVGGVVVATEPVDGGFPESAWVNTAVTDTGLIVFGTAKDSRKAVNLQSNPKVSFVAVDGQGREIQAHAEAHVLAGAEAGQGGQALAQAHPGGEADPETSILVGLSVVWARWVDATQVPPHAKEASF